MLSLLYLRIKAQQYFVNLSYMFLDEERVLKTRLYLALNLTIFRGTGPNLGREVVAVSPPNK